MNWPDAILRWALWAYFSATAIYPFMALDFLRRWRREKPAHALAGEELPPITLLRPLKAGVPALREKLSALVGAMRLDDQLLLGVDGGKEEESAGAELQAAFPERDILVVTCVVSVLSDLRNSPAGRLFAAWQNCCAFPSRGFSP